MGPANWQGSGPSGYNTCMNPPAALPRDYRIAVSDLDETLLRNDGEFSPRTLAAIEAWIGSGRRFVIASGRPARSIYPLLPPMLRETPIICYNGAEIRYGGEAIYRHYIPPNTAHTVVSRALDHDPSLIVGIEIDDELWQNHPRPNASPSSARYHLCDVRTLAQGAVAKVLVFSDDVETVLRLLEPLPEAIRLMPAGRYAFIQLMARDADKVTALRHLVDNWGESMDSVVAFGDDVNDIGILRESALGVAVENAWPPLLEVSDRIAASPAEDGVAQVLEELLG